VAFRTEQAPTDERIFYDGETRHTISGRIFGFYKNTGGSDRYGSPLSAAYISGGMRIQWFESGRIQWRLPDDEAHAAPVGFELARERSLSTGREKRQSLARFDPDRFPAYVGDGVVPESPLPFDPTEIRIPAIGITAAIEQVGIVDGVMGVPENAWNVGWYPSLSSPGTFTNVVMAGHKDWWNIGPVVFWSLELLEPGDMIYLLGEDGRGFSYSVSEKWLIEGNSDAGKVVSDTGHEVLTLITCGGSFNGSEYDSRWIVQADRI
jgi:LPXTG-site transpeptidase (sortase) family protein